MNQTGGSNFSLKAVVGILTVLVVVLVGYIVYPKIKEVMRETPPAYSLHYDPARNPEADMAEAVKDATGAGKKILMIVGGDWCKWSGTLDNLIETNSEVRELLYDNFVVLKVNFSGANKNEKFLAKFPPHKATPHFYVLTEKGILLRPQGTAVLERGYSYDEKKFTAFLREWADK